MGRRIKKTIIPKLSGGAIDTDNIETIYYVLDAQGNTLTKYKTEKFWDGVSVSSEVNYYNNEMKEATNGGQLIYQGEDLIVTPKYYKHVENKVFTGDRSKLSTDTGGN